MWEGTSREPRGAQREEVKRHGATTLRNSLRGHMWTGIRKPAPPNARQTAFPSHLPSTRQLPLQVSAQEDALATMPLTIVFVFWFGRR